jgi:ribosomal protein L29
MGKVADFLDEHFPGKLYAIAEQMPLVHILRAKITVYESSNERLRDELANKELEIQRLRILLEAERSNKPHEPRTIRPRTAAEMRRLVEHQNAEEMEQEAV